MAIEFVKMTVCFVLYVREFGIRQFIPEVFKNLKVFGLYMVPSALYCAYNNLAFVNLSNFDPTTYFLLLQFRVVVTGVIFQILFKKKLSGMQWFSLLLLTIGCIAKELGRASAGHAVSEGNSAILAPSDAAVATVHRSLFARWLATSGGLVLILVQVFCSCFAGVYNEYLLKDGTGVPLMLQNFFMYTDSILCNGLLLLVVRGGSRVVSEASTSLAALLQPLVILIVLNNAAGGVVTSLFLAKLNSILKTFASALELVFTAVFCWILFGISVDVYTAASIVIVITATVLYSQNPVVNYPVLQSKGVVAPGSGGGFRSADAHELSTVKSEK